MPIRIVDSPEPLSARSMQANVDCILVQSDASRLLVQELKRYRNRDVTGRSFLIAGHRGSGKTTLVLDAYLRVLKESQRFALPSRLLLVPLHGPNLLPDTSERPAKPVDDAAEPPPSREADFDTGTQHVLKQITLALYRALAAEISGSYRERVLEKDKARPADVAELLELAAQLELELYDCPDAARLRAIWDRGGFLRSGVLTPVLAGPTTQGKEPVAAAHDKGLREIVALASACEAYKRVAGTYSTKDELVEQAKASESRSAEFNANKDLWSALLALATGGLAGAAAFTAGNAAMAALTGIVSALGAAAVIKFTSTRSRDRSRKREQSFVFDLSTPTLDRILPMICERVARAGLLPVFMVDELDKVKDLHGRMGGMVRHLKKFVAESAFFCFLTDRTYFEQLRQLITRTAHPPEETYFKHSLMVVFTASDLHAYLDRVITEPVMPEAPGSESEGNGAQAAETEEQSADRAARAVEYEKQQSAISTDLADYPLVSYVLLHRSRLHTGGLQRELAALTNQNGELAMPPGRIRTMRACRFDLLIQLAIEFVLDQPDLREAMELEPQRRMLVHDALYYLSREWANGATSVDLSDACRDDFRKYLLTRIAGSLEASESTQGVALSTDTINELLGYVRELAHLVSSPTELKTRLQTSGMRVNTLVLDAIPLQESVIGLVLERDAEHELLYRWRYRHTGQRIIAEHTDVPVSVKRESPPQPAPGAGPDGHAEPTGNTDRVAALGPLGESEEVEELPEPVPPPAMPPPKRTRDVAPPLHAAAPTPATPPESPGALPWRDSSEFINQFASLLQTLTSGVIDFAILSSRLRVIRTSPAWEEVQRAQHRLDVSLLTSAPTSYREFEEDVACVSEFESLLKDSMVTIGAALVCGALVGRASRARDGHAIYLGLKAIADAYGFAELSEGDVYLTLEKVGANLALPGPQAPAFPWGLNQSSLEEFAAQVRTALGWAGDVKLSRELLDEAQALTWAAWQERINAITMPLAPVKYPPIFEELLCAAADLRPGNLLSQRPGEMSARAWSTALYWSLADIAPTNRQICRTWLAPAAVRALGIGTRNLQLLGEATRRRAGKLRESEIERMPALYVGASYYSESSALVVISAKRSVTQNWLPSPRFGVLLLAHEQLERLIGSVPNLFEILDIEHCVIEEPVSEPAVHSILNLVRDTSGGSRPPLNIWTLEPKANAGPQLNLPNRAPEPRRPNVLSGPKSVDEMFDQINAARGR